MSLLIISFLLLFAPKFTFAVQSLPEVQTYEQLLHAIRGVRAASQQRIEQTVDQEKVREAWETGKLVDSHRLESEAVETDSLSMSLKFCISVNAIEHFG